MAGEDLPFAGHPDKPLPRYQPSEFSLTKLMAGVQATSSFVKWPEDAAEVDEFLTPRSQVSLPCAPDGREFHRAFGSVHRSFCQTITTLHRDLSPGESVPQL